MFKRITENEYVQKFLELWQNPRYRSLIILGMYIIFFALVISSIDTSSNNYEESKKVDVMKEYSMMNNYSSKIIIKNELEENINIKVNKNDYLINYNNENYYYNTVKLYKQDGEAYKRVNTNLLDFEVWKFTPKFISDLIEKGTFNSKTEYADGTIANTYLVKIEDFIKSYSNNENSDIRTFEITVYQNEKQVNKVVLNLTNIYNIGLFSNNHDYIVTIEYDLIGKTSPIIVKIESSD